MYNRGLWSVHMVNLVPHRYFRNFFSAQTTPHSSLLVAEYLIWDAENPFDTHTAGLRIPSWYCPNHAPMPVSEASMVSTNGLCRSGHARQVSWRNNSFNCWKAVLRSRVHSIGPFVLRILWRGAEIAATFGLNSRFQFTAPRNLCNALPSFGSGQSLMA